MKPHILDFIKNLELTISFLGEVLVKTFRTDTSLISNDVRKILNNDKDRKKIEDAVNYLKEHTEEKTRDVELTDRKIKISIS